MKRASLKRLFCAILCLVLILTPVVSSYAAGIDAKIPIVHVTGIGRPIYKNPGTDSQTPVFPPSNEAISSMVKQLVLPLGRLALTKDWDKFSYSLADAIGNLFSDFACNDDGTAQDDVGINWSYPRIKSNYTRGDTYTFTYDWRTDPYEIAAQLNDFINYVIDGVGCKKVSINAHSMGGIMTATYISVYGTDKLYSVVMDSTALLGGSIAGEPFAGKINVADLSLTRFIKQILPENEIGAFVKSVLDLLLKAGVTGNITSMANNIVDKVIDIVYEELALVFATCPGMWSLSTAAEYEAAKKLLIKDTEKHAELIKKIDKYHNNVRLKAKDILQSLVDNDVILIITSKYDLQLAPVIESSNISSDAVLDSASTSFGATFAPLGKTLGLFYKQAVNDGHNHISPDRKVDASTCMFPEYTWFIKGMDHSYFSDDYDEMMLNLALAEEQPTVDTYEEYPQFLTYNKAADKLEPTTGLDTPSFNSWFALSINAVRSTIQLIVYLFSLIKTA